MGCHCLLPLSVLQCQNYILADQVSTFQSVAQKAVVKITQAKYGKCCDKVNEKKVHLATAKVETDWGAWDGRSVSSVTQSCLTLCNPMNRSAPGLPVHHQLPESIQTHVHRVSDAIQPSHPLSSPSPPSPNPSQHQGLFQ